MAGLFHAGTVAVAKVPRITLIVMSSLTMPLPSPEGLPAEAPSDQPVYPVDEIELFLPTSYMWIDEAWEDAFYARFGPYASYWL